jgi:hypothetical protein
MTRRNEKIRPPSDSPHSVISDRVSVTTRPERLHSAEQPKTETAELLEAAAGFIRGYVVVSDTQLVANALWTLHTHVFDAADATPYLSITSPEKESGKTRLLEVLELVVARPWLTGRVSAAVLARKVADKTPTLLLDESDAAFNGDREYAETLRGVLNSGHRRGGCSSLCVGQGASMSYVDLSTFCPKAIAGIGHLPDTVSSRSITIRLKRKAPGEQVKRFRRREAQETADPLHQWLVSWGEFHVDRLAEARPELPAALGDRAADCWEPLLAIADLAGGDWPHLTRTAAVELSGGDTEDGSVRVRLLADCRTMFDGYDHLKSKELIAALCDDEEAPWGSWHKGTPISARALARLLEPFGIHSRNIRQEDGSVPKGYLRESFEDAWKRYLPFHPPDLSATTLHPASVKGLKPFPIRYTTPFVADSEQAANPHDQADVADVADGNPVRSDSGVLELRDGRFCPECTTPQVCADCVSCAEIDRLAAEAS